MILRPPRSTLFPYTTALPISLALRLVMDAADHRVHPAVVRPVGDVGVQPVGDRKSTRLNSSHVEISYAVFCLKKKKEYQRSQDQSARRKPWSSPSHFQPCHPT